MSVRSQRNALDKHGVDSRMNPAFLLNNRRSRVPISRQLFLSRRGMNFPLLNSISRAEHSFSRASAAWNTNPAGVLQSFVTNLDRWDDRFGPDRTCFLSEGTKTNFLLNSTAPATQTTGSLATGTYILWIEGTGTATVTAGTGTATGLGAATAGSPRIFTVTVAGTFTVTNTGSVTRFQLEDGSVPTSFIVTAGATVQRQVDSLVWTPAAAPGGSGLFGTAGTIVAMFRLPGVSASGGANQAILSIDKNVNDNDRISVLVVNGAQPATIGLRVVNASTTTVTQDHTSAINANTFYKVAVAWDAAGASIAVTGKSTVLTGAGTVPTGLLALRWGRLFANGSSANGLIGLVERRNTRATSAQLLDLVRNV